MCIFKQLYGINYIIHTMEASDFLKILQDPAVRYELRKLVQEAIHDDRED
jgi:hypothetical protein